MHHPTPLDPSLNPQCITTPEIVQVLSSTRLTFRLRADLSLRDSVCTPSQTRHVGTPSVPISRQRSLTWVDCREPVRPKEEPMGDSRTDVIDNDEKQVPHLTKEFGEVRSIKFFISNTTMKRFITSNFCLVVLWYV